MANNRMWLCFKPSGRAVCLGKRMGWGWYNAPHKEFMDAFLAKCEDDACEHGSQDDFVLCFEEQDGWSFGPDREGFCTIVFDAPDAPTLHAQH